MALDKDLLDPSVDLKPHLQGAFEKMAQQDGGRNNRVQQYRVLASQGKGPSEVMALSYDEQMKRDQEKITPQPETDIRNDPRFFSDAHLVGMEGINPVGYPFGQQPTGGNLGTGDSSPMASPLGGANPDSQSEWMPNTGNPNQLGTTGGGTAPVIDPSQIDVSKVEAIQKQINDLLSKPHPVYEGAKMPDPTGPQAALTALALLFAPNDQAGNILEALHGNLDAVRKRNDIIHQVYQQTQDANDKAQLEALMQAARVEESRAFHQAQLTQQANITNAGNQVKTEAEAGKNQRAAARIGSEMQKFQERMKHLDNKKGQDVISEFQGRQAILKTTHPEWTDEQVDEEAAKYANAAADAKVSSAALNRSRKEKIDKMLPIDIALGNSRVKLTDTQREWVRTKIDHYPDYLDAMAQRSAQGWARIGYLYDSLSDRQAARDTASANKLDSEVASAEQDQYNLLGQQIKQLQESLKYTVEDESLGSSVAELAGAEVINATLQELKRQRAEIAQRMYERNQSGMTGQPKASLLNRAKSVFLGGKRPPVIKGGIPDPRHMAPAFDAGPYVPNDVKNLQGDTNFFLEGLV